MSPEMNSSTGLGRRQTLAVVALAVGLLGSGVALVLTAGDPPLLDEGMRLPWWALIPFYAAAWRAAILIEVRRVGHGVSLTQVPLALGAVLVDPVLHLQALLIGSLFVCVVLERQSALKVLFNAGFGVLELGVVTLAVGYVGNLERPEGRLWVAVLLGLLVGDLLGHIALSVVVRLHGGGREPRDYIETFALVGLCNLIFASSALVALSAAFTDPVTIPAVLLLGLALSLAYRGYRRLLARQQTTEVLLAFVRELGPLDPNSNAPLPILQKMRDLLAAEQLELHLVRGGRTEARVFRVDESGAMASSESSFVPGTGAGLVDDRMTTALTGSTGLLGVLVATHRLGPDRSFDQRDLRMLESVGTELSAALERGDLLAALEMSATTDSLTLLPNLQETTRRLELLAEQHPGGVLLAAVAVDSFREVNDTLGHLVGDELLLEVTRRLRLVSGVALLGRIGGGRFAVAVPAELAGDDAAMFGLGLRTQVEGAAQLGPVGTHVRLSVGLVRAPDHGSDGATLLRRAETAMYGARHAHGGPVMWEPVYEVQGQRRLAVIMALREALATGAIGVAFQPKIDAGDGRVVGVEALARWTHPALGNISPDEFIPLAEASSLMAPLTASVMRQALTACKGWQRRAGRIGVAVNVSADTVLDASFVTEVAALLTAADCDPGLLTLELTEGVVVADPDLARERMTELRALGVRLSVDDFGTGYSSLTYLKGLPIDEVKVDKGFVAAVVDSAADQAVVRAVVDIAHTLGVIVVAEGVEQEDQQKLLQRFGVDALQGYLYARPMPALAMAAWLRRREQDFALR